MSDTLERLREQIDRANDPTSLGPFLPLTLREQSALLDIAEVAQGTKRWLDTFDQEQLDRIPIGLLLNLGGLMSKLAALDFTGGAER